MHKEGYDYQRYANKFIKGKIVSGIEANYDIETKRSLYEVKGCRVYLKNPSGSHSLGRYQIKLDHHNALLKDAEEKDKDP